jgi:hypothetical protein
MAEKAHVTSLDAIDAFRAALLVYIGKARPTLEEVSAEVLRTRMWLENEQRSRLEAELRNRARDLEQAQQALFSSRISNLREETAAEVQAVHRAKRALEETEAKLRALKRWIREFDSRVQPVAKQLEKFHTVLSVDLPKAAAYLDQAMRTLEAYAEVGPAPGAGSVAANVAEEGSDKSQIS